MKYRTETYYTDSKAAPGRDDVPVPIEQWGTEEVYVERYDGKELSVWVGNELIEGVTHAQLQELQQALAFYLAHQGDEPDPSPHPPTAVVLPSRGGSWVELEELYQRMQDWTLIGAKSEIMSTLLNYEAWRVEMDAGRGTIEGSDGRRHTVATLFAPLVNKRRQKVRKAGTGRERKRKAA